MRKTLGIDYGRSKVGIAIGFGWLAEPFRVVRVNSFDDALGKIKKEIEIQKPDITVVGCSEGEMGKESKKFATEIGAVVFDETLTSVEAKKIAIENNSSRKKIKRMEDAYAAAIILQNYLDSQKS